MLTPPHLKNFPGVLLHETPCKDILKNGTQNMSRIPREVAGFALLPVTLPGSTAYPEDVQHYLFIKRQESPDEEEISERSLFMTNIPSLTTELHIKNLFKIQLQAGLVDQVVFSDETNVRESSRQSQNNRNSRKRKRITADDLDNSLEAFKLPSIWTGTPHVLGSNCVAVFVDKASADMALKAVKKAAKLETKLDWGEGIEEQLPPTGLERYKQHNTAQYPSRNDMVELVDDYMSAYNQMMELRSRDAAKKRQTADKDGFIPVMRGTRGAARKEDIEEVAAKHKQKSRTLEDFYRFQMREKRKEGQMERLKEFEEDKRRVEELKRRRGKI